MQLLRLMRMAPSQMAVIVALSLASTAGGIGALAMIDRVSTEQSAASLAIFVAIVLGLLAATAAMNFLIARAAGIAVTRLRLDLAERFISIPLASVEEMGAPAVLAALIDDVQHIATGLAIMPGMFTSVAVLVAGLLYIGVVAWKVAIAVLAYGILCTIVIRPLSAFAGRSFDGMREEQEALFRHFETIASGVKELKLSEARRKTFLGTLLAETADKVRMYYTRASFLVTFIAALSQLLFVLMIGFLAFGLAWLHLDAKAYSMIMVVLLYLLAPLGSLARFAHVFLPANIALAKLSALGVSIEAGLAEKPPSRPPHTECPHLNVIDAAYAYPGSEDEAGFSLGPITVSLRQGTITLLLGGNGSGKSTLIKVLTGLYPAAGELRLGDEMVTEANRSWYRQHFSAIFSDYHLFSEVATALDGADVVERAKQLLDDFKLASKVKIVDGAFSTTKLSRGQRKRLALVLACLEDRPIYVFDEWAADQDPTFKQIFYLKILPELKARGKIVLVATHDERYFHIADEIIKLENGKLADESTDMFMQRLTGVAGPVSVRSSRSRDAAADEPRRREELFAKKL